MPAAMAQLCRAIADPGGGHWVALERVAKLFDHALGVMACAWLAVRGQGPERQDGCPHMGIKAARERSG